MQLFEGSGTFFVQRVDNLKINLTLFKNTFCFQDIVFHFEMSIYFKVICIEDAFFTGICGVFEHVIIFIL